ncbi:ATP-grasp domain-containing protein [Aliagarivorans marinus]|uniref:carboxylate--amine ligase n=1 Tax=Aliagarivorans marinus TaxID=561965 RepID=UPI0003FAFCEB|nr:ATP-grasp domain-containing protein [Aliagarivorans marinus]
MEAILVLDANQRSALAVTRSLGATGDYQIDCADDTAQALAGCSRHCRDYLQSPSPAEQPLAFIGWLAQQLSQRQYRWVLPMTEISSRLLLAHQAQLPDLAMPFAPLEVVTQLSDKVQLTQRAQQLGLAVPETRYLNDASELDSSSCEFPCVLKPYLSRIYQGDHWLSTEVHIIHNPQQLEQALQLPYFQGHPFMLQAFVPGHGGGIFCYYQRGRMAAHFAHCRLREKPPGGGVSVLSESRAADPQLLAAAQQLLDDANWHGVAMVEFRIGDDGTAYLMEVNTRFWGSLQLAIDAGVDFPKLLLAGESAAALPPQPAYRQGQQLRWLLGDLDSLYICLKSSNYSAMAKLRRIAAFLLPKFSQRKHEVNRLDDLGPAKFELWQYLLQLIGKH